MRDPREARRILDALPVDELKALEELAHWMESASQAEGFRPAERAALLFAIDDAAQPRLRKAARDYAGGARLSRYQENRIWTQVHEYFKQASLALARAVDALAQVPKASDPRSTALAAARALRAAAQQVKWQHLRYGPVDAGVWGLMHRLYALCESRGIAEQKLELYAASETSARLEYLKALAFGAASPDSLLASQIETAERVIAELAPGFALAPAPGPGLLYWTDLARGGAPQRIARSPERSPGLRCFGPGAALDALGAMIQRAQSARDEPLVEVLRYLALVWSPEPPERRHTRHHVKSRLAVVYGFTGVLEALGDAASLDFDRHAAESWVVENVSAGGFGAVVPQAKGDWLRVGTLLAMQPEGGTNWIIGAIRRVTRVTAQEARVGIETLSRAPKVARFRIRGLGDETGVLLPAAMLGSEEVAVALRAGVYPPGQNLEATIDGREHVYLPQGTREHTQEYDLVRFKEMVRES